MVSPLEGLDKYPRAVIIVDGMSDHKRCAAEGCNRFVPDERRFHAIYCSKKCASRTQARRYRERHPKPKEEQA